MRATVAATLEPSVDAERAAEKAAQRAARPRVASRSPSPPTERPEAPLADFLATRTMLLASQPPAEAMKLSPRLMPYRPASAQPRGSPREAEPPKPDPHLVCTSLRGTESGG